MDETQAQGGDVDGSDVAPPPPPPSGVQSRAAKLAAVREGLKAISAGEKPAATVAPAPAPKAAAAPAAEDEASSDPQASKAIEAIEKRDRRAREQLAAERAAWKAERELEVAELARLRAEQPKAPSLDELKKLPPSRRAIEAMKLAGLDPDDEDVMEVIARDAYARSKSGKADPKNRVYADQVAEKNGLETQLAEMRRMIEETRETLTQRDQRQALEAFQSQYLAEALKAVPADPSFIGLAHAANPAKAKAALLSIGQRIERDTGETPSHAEVIAEYERATREDLTDRGFSEAQIAAMLAPPAAPKKPAPAPMRATIDPSAGPSTAPVDPTTTREQKLARAREGLKKLNATTT